MNRKATREPGPATLDTTKVFEDDDIPSRAELVQAALNLRVKSEAEYVEYKRLESMNYIGAARAAEEKWVETLGRLDNMIDGIELMDAITADLANYDTP